MTVFYKDNFHINKVCTFPGFPDACNNRTDDITLSGWGNPFIDFFYVNPLSADGSTPFNHGSNLRQPWFNCSCCPTNDVRFIPSLPGYVYATNGDSLYVNLFVAGHGTGTMGDQRVRLRQETNSPWEGRVRLRIDPERRAEFTLRVRIPGWATNQPVPSDLYRFLETNSAAPVLKINGETVNPTIEKGYALLHRAWQPGDAVGLVGVLMNLGDALGHNGVGDAALGRGTLSPGIEPAG